MNDQETILIVQKFNTRGLAITKDKTNLPPLYGTQKKHNKQ